MTTVPVEDRLANSATVRLNSPAASLSPIVRDGVHGCSVIPPSAAIVPSMSMESAVSVTEPLPAVTPAPVLTTMLAVVDADRLDAPKAEAPWNVICPAGLASSTMVKSSE